MQRFISDKEAEKLLTKAWNRKPGAKKGDSGKVLIIGGSEDYAGCLCLAGIAALRAGCDWVTIAAPEKIGWAVAALSPDLVVKKLEGKDFHEHHWKILSELIDKHDVFLIGNGMSKGTHGLIQLIVRAYPKKKKVIDAEAIRALRLQDVHNSIFTPHQKEYALLLKNSKLKDLPPVFTVKIGPLAPNAWSASESFLPSTILSYKARTSLRRCSRAAFSLAKRSFSLSPSWVSKSTSTGTKSHVASSHVPVSQPPFIRQFQRLSLCHQARE
jgi:hypothetical protein